MLHGRLMRVLQGGLALSFLAALFACRSDDGSAGAETPMLERATIGQISWYVDYDAAVEVAREQDKALWVHFGENPG